MRKELLCAALCLCVVAVATDDYGSAEWKSEIAHGYLPYRKLKFDDFPVANGRSTDYWMHTQGFFHYSFQSSWSETSSGFTARVTSLTVRSGFDRNKSWKRDDITETKALLEHEQGHLDILELHAQDFEKAPMPTGNGPTSKMARDDLTNQIEAINRRVEGAANAEQERYDRETNHGASSKPQSDWTARLKARLKDANITFWDAPG